MELHLILYHENENEVKTLEKIWEEHDLKLAPKQKKVDKIKHVCKEMHDPPVMVSRLLILMQCQIRLDEEARRLCVASGIDVSNITTAHAAYPLITKKVQ